VLLPFLVTLALSTIGALIVAKVAHAAMGRLGLELYGVLLWLGLAEDRVDELSAWRAGTSRRHLSRRRLGRARSA
jgi:hypothetical protein